MDQREYESIAKAAWNRSKDEGDPVFDACLAAFRNELVYRASNIGAGAVDPTAFGRAVEIELALGRRRPASSPAEGHGEAPVSDFDGASSMTAANEFGVAADAPVEDSQPVAAAPAKRKPRKGAN